MSGPQPIELLIKARWVLPIIPENRLLEDCALAIDSKGNIVALLPQEEATRRFIPAHTIELPNHLLMPGLVNCHGHTPMTLLRGVADDQPLEIWLQDHIFPAEKRLVSDNFVRDGSMLAIAEMIRSGTTCFSDMYFYPEQTAHMARQVGIRSQIMFPVFSGTTPWSNSAEECFAKGLELHDAYRSSDLISVGFGPHAPYSVGMEILQKIAVLAQELDAPIQIHAHETAQEVKEFVQAHGKRPLQQIADAGLLSPLLQLVHMTQVNAADMALLNDSGAHVVHCPRSNLKLASGFTPVHQLLEAGINVALGTDGAASNNSLDMFAEMNMAALLAKAVAGDATALEAHRALRMATLSGALALGLEHRIGSLETGKAADVIAIDLHNLESQPLYNPVSQLVYTQTGHRVSHVWVAGKPLLQNRQLETLNEREVIAKARWWQQNPLTR